MQSYHQRASLLRKAEPQQQRWPGHWELHPPFVYWLWCSLQNISTTFFLHMKWHLVFCQNVWPDRLIIMEKIICQQSTVGCCHTATLPEKKKERKVYSYNIKSTVCVTFCTNSCQISWRDQQQSGKVPGHRMCAHCELTQLTLIVPDWTFSLISVGGRLCSSLTLLLALF